ncbi:phosphorylase, Pnp/Udp family [Streptococcus pyogenes MGAS2111]|nr:phosphorylase, Pnp/Udp family [Streptococcus pyogenes MGAS2111]
MGQLLFTADTLADVEVYDQRNWGADSLVCAPFMLGSTQYARKGWKGY